MVRTEAPAVDEKHLTPAVQPVVKLDCKEAFNLLTDKEQKYLHYFSKASWLGSRIVFEQCSPESPQIFAMFQILFGHHTVTKVRGNASISKWPEEDSDLFHFYNYATQFYGNQGNYLSFGDSKFIPRIEAEKFKSCIDMHTKFLPKPEKESVKSLWKKVKGPIYLLDDKTKSLGVPSECTSSYYSANITKEDMDVVQAYMKEKKLEAWNTRLFKRTIKEKEVLEIRYAASIYRIGPLEDYKGRVVSVSYGDYGTKLGDVVENLILAKRFAANDTQGKMLAEYIEHFQTGYLEKHKESQKHWVEDKGPAVETTLGFIENYRDGYGERAEFEGMVACVNKQQSRKFGELVAGAEEFIAKLPWPKAFEKEKFQQPDFTALDVVTFANSGIPVGINIPNYDEVREHFGFKNVHLHNVLTSRWGKTDKEPVNFIEAKDQDLFKELRIPSFEVQVGLHELLGHGTGKLLYAADLKKGKIQHPITHKPITKVYDEGETWASAFGALSSSWEECRAEAVGIYLSLEDKVLDIFGYTGKQQKKDIIKVNWLAMAHSGLAGSEMYNPEKKKWGQAHSQARFAILQILEKSGVITFKDKGTPDMLIQIHEEKIYTTGKKAIGDFLVQLQVYKSCADFAAGKKLFDELTILSPEWIKCRDVVMSKRKPRQVYVQASTKLDPKTNKVQLTEFAASPAGVLLSMQYHFGDREEEDREEELEAERAATAKKSKKGKKGKGRDSKPEEKTKSKGKGKGGGKKPPRKIIAAKRIKIGQIEPNSGNVDLYGKVLRAPDTSEKKPAFVLADDSGKVRVSLSFRGEIKEGSYLWLMKVKPKVDDDGHIICKGTSRPVTIEPSFYEVADIDWAKVNGANTMIKDISAVKYELEDDKNDTSAEVAEGVTVVDGPSN